MSYISQIIVFALALMGTLFQSTKTDADGKTVYTKSGLPVLTTVGKVVVTLLTISFGISLLSVWQGEKAESEARERARVADEKLESVKQYNRGIKDTLDQVFVQNKELTDDQRRQFAEVLGEQKKGGEELAGRIGDSADLLRSRIEGSSNLLRGRIDSSIDVLNLTAGNIASLADPIRVINVKRLALEVPLTHPALAGYRNRLEAGIREFRAGSAGSSSYGLSMDDEVPGKPPIFSIQMDSPLLPRPGSELVAEHVLTTISMDILLYRPPLGEEQLATAPPLADLRIPVFACMKRLKVPSAVEWPRPCYVTEIPEFSDFSLFYDPESRRATLLADNLEFNPPSSVSGPEPDGGEYFWFKHWVKRPGGRVNGSPDLAGTQVVARIDAEYPGLNASPKDNMFTMRAIDEIRRQMRLRALIFAVSDQFTFGYAPAAKSLQRSRYGTLALPMAERTNKDGFPFYFYNLPDLEKLLDPTP